MIIITGTIELGSLDDVEQAKQALVRKAQRSRTDTGCIEYVFSQNLENPAEVRLTEKWENAELLRL